MSRAFGHDEHRGRAAHCCDDNKTKILNMQSRFAPPECRAVIDPHECKRHAPTTQHTTLRAAMQQCRSLALSLSLIRSLSLPPSHPIPLQFPIALARAMAEETRPWPFCFANLRCTARRRSAGLQRRPASKGTTGLGHLLVPCDAGLPESGCAAGETCHGGMRSSASAHSRWPVCTSILTAKVVTSKGAAIPSSRAGTHARDCRLSGSPPHRRRGGAWRCGLLEMQR